MSMLFNAECCISVALVSFRPISIPPACPMCNSYGNCAFVCIISALVNIRINFNTSLGTTYSK